VERQHVSVVLDQSVPAGVQQQVQEAVAGAAGIDTARGDTITVSSVAFAKPPAPPAASPVKTFIGPAKWAGLALATLLFLFFVTRAIRRRESLALGGEPTWLTEISSPRPVAELAGGAGQTPTLALPQAPTTQRAVEQLADKEPAILAQQLSTWMSED
jgi:flagellar M-ring protein FliF